LMVVNPVVRPPGITCQPDNLARLTSVNATLHATR
jgi:hypothetical protein